MLARFYKSALTGLAFVLAAAALAFAAVPTTFNYQGYLKNHDGTPVTAATSS